MTDETHWIDAAECPFEVRCARMVHRWETLTFLHWRYEPAAVARLLPAGLELETFEGEAWVSLVPFHMTVAAPRVKWTLPWLSRFPETNVRTYVHSRATGESGIWFFSLDAARLAPVLTARTGFGLPYFWSRMAVGERDGLVGYVARRGWPGPRGATSRVTVEVGDALAPAELHALDHFLTARWVVFSVRRARLLLVRAEHPPWPLHRAEVTVYDELVAAAGLPNPQGEPLVHYSPGVEVRIGAPERVEVTG